MYVTPGSLDSILKIRNDIVFIPALRFSEDKFFNSINTYQESILKKKIMMMGTSLLMRHQYHYIPNLNITIGIIKNLIYIIQEYPV